MKIRQTSFKRLTNIMLVVALLAVPVWTQVKGGDKNVLAAFEKSIDDGATTMVEADLFRYVVANPKDARGFALLAKLRYKQRRLTEARSLAAKALTIDAALVDAKLTLARVNFELGDSDSARAVIATIAETDVTDVGRRLATAETAAVVGDCPRALVMAEKLPLPIRNGKALSLRAKCHLEAGDQQKFTALTPLAKAQVKQNPAVVIEFAGVLMKAAMFRETTDLLRLVIVAAPQNQTALLLLSKAEISLKDFAKARIHLAQAEKTAPESPELFFVKALLESEQGDNAKSLALIERALAAKPDDVEFLARYVVIALRASQNGKAFRAAERLLAIQPSNLDYLYLQGIAALQSNNLPVAETALTRLLAARPADSLGCLALGLTFAAQPERIVEARRQLDSCLATNPDNYEAAYQLGLSYKVQGETATAIRYLEQTVRLAPVYAAALRDLGAVYLQSGEELKARPVLEKSATLAPNDADVHFQLSRLYNLLGEPELARKHLEIFQKLKDPKKDGM